MISGKTKLLGLMGKPVAHSLSPRMHNASFAAEGLDYVYVAMEVDPEDLLAAVRGAAAMGFRGFNLTMPHKERILSLLDELDGAAEVSGAVNTVVLDGTKLRGFNTDGGGMMEACREAGARLPGSRVLLLGAGGAASAIAFAALSEGAAELHIFNRERERAEGLAARLRKLRSDTKVLTYSLRELDEARESGLAPEVLINATSLGMREDDPLPVPAEYLRSLDRSTVVSDAVYHPGERTRLLGVAAALGLQAVDGQRMLLYQGVQAQRLWTGLEPNVRVMAEQLGGSR